MLKTLSTNNGRKEYYVKCNWHERELKSWNELENSTIAEWFGDNYDIDGEDKWVPRFVEYRGAWYDTHETEIGSSDVKALGFDSWQIESYFSAVVFSWFDKDGYERNDAVVVGYIHW